MNEKPHWEADSEKKFHSETDDALIVGSETVNCDNVIVFHFVYAMPFLWAFGQLFRDSKSEVSFASVIWSVNVELGPKLWITWNLFLFSFRWSQLIIIYCMVLTYFFEQELILKLEWVQSCGIWIAAGCVFHFTPRQLAKSCI